MKERPLPSNLLTLKLGWEADVTLAIRYSDFLHYTVEKLDEFINLKGFWLERVYAAPFQGPHGCYLLERVGKSKPPLIKQTRKIRERIAREIGLEPAAFYVFIEDMYDREFLQTYRYSFSTRCVHGGVHCVRPSHLITTTYSGAPLR